MANNAFKTTAKVSMLALEVLRNKGVLLKGMNKQYSEEFAQRSSGNVGYTVFAKKPPRYVTGEGPVIEPQGTVITHVPIKIEHQTNAAVSIQASDYTLSDTRFQETILEPIISQIANDIEKIAFAELTPKVANFFVSPAGLGTLDGTGTPNTSTEIVTALGTAGQILTEMAAPEDDRMAIVAPKVNTRLVAATSNLFNPQADTAKRFGTGRFGEAMGFEFAKSVNVRNLTNGTLNSTFATGASAQGLGNVAQSDATTPFSLTIAAPGGTIKVGQKINAANIFAVNPVSRESLGRLQTFTVVGNGTVGTDVSATDTTIQILPYPVFTGPFQNVYSATNAIPGSTTLTSVSGLNGSTYTQNLMFVEQAFTMATARLWTPKNQDAAFASDSDSGLSIRFVRDWYDPRTDQVITRFDVLWGVAAPYPELAVICSG